MTKKEFMNIVFSNIFEIIAYVVTPILIILYMPEVEISVFFYTILAIGTITILTCLESRSRRAINVMIPTAFFMFMLIWTLSYDVGPSDQPNAQAMSMAVYFVATIAFCCLVMFMLVFAMVMLFFMWLLVCVREKRLISYTELKTIGTEGKGNGTSL